MRMKTASKICSKRRGAALVIVGVAMVGMAMLSFAILTVSRSAADQQRGSRNHIGARYIAEAGLADAMFAMSSGSSGNRGSEDAPLDFGESEYWVVAQDLGSDLTRLTATGVDGQGGSRIELVVRQTNASFFRWGAFGDEWLDMDSQAKIDSYDSDLGPYEDQAINGSGSDSYANANGSTGSNGDIVLSQNSKIYGDATPGVDGTTTGGGNTVITGSTAPMPEPVELPPIEVPDLPSMGDLTIGGGSRHNLVSGDHRFEDLRVGAGAELHVHGPATIVLSSWDLASRSNVVIHAEDGPVTFYVENDFMISSNVSIASTTFTPADLQINLLSDNIINPEDDIDLDQLDFDSNSVLYGTIYAPEASIDIDSNFQLYGAVVARRLHLDSNSRIHFDEALLRAGSDGDPAYEAIYWKELAYSVR